MLSRVLSQGCYEQDLDNFAHISSYPSTLESDKAVEDVLASKGREKSELITKMLDDEKYQREAFQVNFHNI